MFYIHERNFGCRITEYIYHGLRTIAMENELIRITVLADKGTDIIEFLYKPTDTDFLWRSPLGVRNPALHIPTISSPRGAFLDFYEGGWQEIMPAGGEPCTYKGSSFGVHGEVSLIPWEYIILENTPQKIVVKFKVRTYRTPFLVEKTFTLEANSSYLIIDELIKNEGQEEMDLMWGHHPAFGAPFLDNSCVIDFPKAKVLTRELDATSRTMNSNGFDWPIVIGKNDTEINLSSVPTPDTRNHDWACLYEFSEGWYALTNQKKQVGFGLVWPKEVFPYLWYWQCIGGAFGYPFFGRVYTMALEPWTSYPDDLTKAVQVNTTIKLSPNEAISAQIMAIAYSGISRVNGFTKKGSPIT